MKIRLVRSGMLCRTLILCFLSALFAFPAAVLAETPQEETARLQVIGKLTSKIFAYKHYRKQAQDATLSSTLFDTYLKLLDPAKLYFTQEDVAQFESHRFHLFDQLNNGQLQLPFAIYKRYLQRLAEFRAFAEEYMKQGADFTADETFAVDRSEGPFCANDAELKDLWRKRVKNDLLFYRLLNRVQKEAREKAAAEAAKKGETLPAQKLWDTKSPEDKVRIRLRDLCNAASQLDNTDILGIYLTAVAQVYGPHSNYSTPKQDEDFDIAFKLSLSGIGATLTMEDGYTKIVDLVPGGPAQLDGRLQVEDRIIAVAQDGEEPVDIIDMSVSNVVKMVRGKAGTRVTLTVLPAAQGANAVPAEYTITRAQVELKESEASSEIRLVKAPDGSEKKIGVIKLNNFYMDFDGASRGVQDYRSCTRDVRKLLTQLEAEKVDVVVMDMRANGGGALLEAITLSGLFIKQGPIVQVRDASKRVEVQQDPDASIAYRGKLVVLLSKLSASSTEIFAGAMKDYNRALLLGDTRTYGKGTVLGVAELSDMLHYMNWNVEGGSVTYETAMFYRINGESNQQKGIEPDVVIPSYTESMEIGEMFNDNHLPWDKIGSVQKPVKVPAMLGYVPLTDATRKTLAEHFKSCLGTDPELKKLVLATKRFKEVRDRKVLSLNEEKRLQEYYAEKEANDRADELLDGVENKDKKEKTDLVLNAALGIAAEYAAQGSANAGK